MEAAMYADLFAWRGTLFIVLLFVIPYVIYELRKKEKHSQNDEPEQKEESPDTRCPCCCSCRRKTCQTFDEISD